MDIEIATPRLIGGLLIDCPMETPTAWAVKLHAFQGDRRLDVPRCISNPVARRAYRDYAHTLEALLQAGI